MKTLKELETIYKPIKFQEQWVKVNAKCSKCGGQLYKNNYLVLTSWPEQHQYKCEDCGNVETSILDLPESYSDIDWTDILFPKVGETNV